MSSFTSSLTSVAIERTVPTISLPEKLIVGYANWNECENISIVHTVY